MLLTNGWTMTSGLTFTASGTPVPPFIPLATLDPATANASLTLTGQTVTINNTVNNWAAICSTDGAWPLPTSTSAPLSFSLELVVNETITEGEVFMGTVLTNSYSNTTQQAGFFGPGGSFIFMPPVKYSYVDGTQTNTITTYPGSGIYYPVNNGDVIGFAVDISNTILGNMEYTLYLNGNIAGDGYPKSITVGTTGSITPFVAYKYQSNTSPASVTLRTNPATFSYANSYTNQDGWPLAPVVPPPPSGGNLVMTFNTALSGTNTVYLPIGGTGVNTVDVLINWGDYNYTTANSTNLYSHTYAATGVYQVTITGTMGAYGNYSLSDLNNALVSIDSWDSNLSLINLGYAFWDAVNLTSVPNTLPSTVTLLDVMFYGANTFNQNLNGWNTINVTSMNQVFDGATAFNGNIANWNTSNVTTMVGMFSSATSFNQNISSWNTGKVTSMEIMFFNATAFNQNLSDWNVANVTNHVDFDTGATSWQTNYKPNF